MLKPDKLTQCNDSGNNSRIPYLQQLQCKSITGVYYKPISKSELGAKDTFEQNEEQEDTEAGEDPERGDACRERIQREEMHTERGFKQEDAECNIGNQEKLIRRDSFRHVIYSNDTKS